MLPELEAALLAGHDLVLLGERGQGKTRLMRTVGQLLDEWSPEVAGCEIHDDPYAPVCVRCRGLAADLGDDLPVAWRHREDRYTEKLATPDTSVGDLIGDVDPVKVAQGRTLGDPETVHYGLVPRTNRGLFGLNELPDLAERIQVALFNVLEERDIQVRGYSLRLPLDLLLISTANPEDYTNRGRIITPLKDRFGAEIRTHYLSELGDEIALLAQESEVVAEVGEHLLEVLARFTRSLRESSAIDQRSGVSARFAIAAAEGVSGSALRRAARTGDLLDHPVARVCDLPQVVPTLLGKIEFEMGRRAASVRCWTTCCGWPLPRRSATGWAGSTSPVSPRCSPRDRWWRPATWCRPVNCSSQLGTLPGSVEGAGPARLRRRRRTRAGRGGGRIRPGGPVPDPPDREGHRRRPDRLRRLTMSTGGDRVPSRAGEVEDRSAAMSGRYDGRFRYGAWRGGPDPLAPPYDVRAAMDRLGQDMLSSGNLSEAIRDLLRKRPRRSGRAGPAGREDPPAADSRLAGAATSAARWIRSEPRWTRR